MLIVSRKTNEIITIEPIDPLDRSTLADVFEHGPIEIKLVKIGDSRVRIAIHAPNELRICRGPRHDTDASLPEHDELWVRAGSTVGALKRHD